jgi:FkbM family methyltransferase
MRLDREQREGTELLFRPNTHDRSILEETWTKRVYWKGFPSAVKDAVVVDVGAHNGYFSVFAARHMLAGSRVYAFEPVAENYAILQQNLGINDVRNVVARNAAVSGHGQAVKLFVTDAHTGGHSIYSERHATYTSANVTAVEVPSVAFHETVPQDVDTIHYCKMDCEGAEFEILLNAPASFLRKVAVYAMEFHEFGGHRLSELQDLFRALDYDVECTNTPSRRGIVFGSLLATRSKSPAAARG